MNPNTPADIRFWMSVDRSAGDDGCWPWQASCSPNGYGKLRVNGRMVVASRGLAHDYGISGQAVGHIVCRRTWQDVGISTSVPLSASTV